jgi:hypothetical protein
VFVADAHDAGEPYLIGKIEAASLMPRDNAAESKSERLALARGKGEGRREREDRRRGDCGRIDGRRPDLRAIN